MTDQILELAEKLKYIKSKGERVNVFIDNNIIDLSIDKFIAYVSLELQSGKTLVSAIRDTVFKKIRFSS